jgi:hypothetical protein
VELNRLASVGNPSWDISSTSNAADGIIRSPLGGQREPMCSDG